MIPVRVHRDLPDDVAWVITERRGQLIVYLANDIRPGSPLEQQFVRQAVRAWRHRHHGGILALPGLVAAPGVWRGMREHSKLAGGIVGGIAVGGLALAAAIALSGPDGRTPARPPAAVAPSASRPPSHEPGPARPRVPSPSPPARPGHPNPPPVKVGAPAGRPVRGEGGPPSPPPHMPPRTPPHTPPPMVKPTGPPVVADPPAPAKTCRLADLHVGKLVRICL